MDGLKTGFINQDKLPIVIEPMNPNLSLEDAIQLIGKHQNELKQLLVKHGGILFRGFPIHDEKNFSSLIKTMKTGDFIDYIGGDSPRNKVHEGIYTSTEAPPSVKIPLHNELSFVKKYPKYIYFYCHIPPVADGETIISDARKVFDSIDPKIKAKFQEKGLKYVSNYYYKSKVMELLNSLQPSHKSWIQVFETEDKKEVEQKCIENEFGFKWNKNDWIQISQKRPAIMQHPETKENIWFNQVHLYDFNPRLLGNWRYAAAKLFYCRPHTILHEVYFEDGTKIPREDLYHVLDKLDENTIAFPWQKGDVLLLDNVLTMHGRNTFKGKRRVMTAMTG